VGAALIDAAAARAAAEDRRYLAAWGQRLRDTVELAALRTAAMDEGLAAIAMRYPDRSLATTHPTEFPLVIDRARARFGAWYEMFPRSCSTEPGAHGTLRDCEARLEYVAKMGFDVLYQPPVHPIGRQRRKGRNNALEVKPEDVGSPWAIGAAEGGHKALHPELGTLEDFRRLVARARELGLELAVDVAFQCAPDHPYVSEHPQWFRWRPDGTVQYAENPPKKYQDIFPFDFESSQWAELWQELVFYTTNMENMSTGLQARLPMMQPW
jgi:starch synthase (maltosyl-transferring)